MLAAEKKRQSQLFEKFERSVAWPSSGRLGTDPRGCTITYTPSGPHDPWDKKVNSSRPLDRRAAAEARVTDTTSSFSAGKAMIMPRLTAPLARKETANAIVVFTNGVTHTTGLDGSRAVREAREACRGIQRTRWCFFAERDRGGD